MEEDIKHDTICHLIADWQIKELPYLSDAPCREVSIRNALYRLVSDAIELCVKNTCSDPIDPKRAFIFGYQSGVLAHGVGNVQDPEKVWELFEKLERGKK